MKVCKILSKTAQINNMQEEVGQKQVVLNLTDEGYAFWENVAAWQKCSSVEELAASILNERVSRYPDEMSWKLDEKLGGGFATEFADDFEGKASDGRYLFHASSKEGRKV